MTCIVGVVEKDRVWIGGDACGSNAQSWQDVGNVKVFGIGELLLGVAGSFRVIDLLRYQVPCARANDEPIDRFVRTAFVGALWDALERGKVNDAGAFDGAILVGVSGRLYEVQSDYSVLAAPPWGTAIGSGEDAARGSLHTTNTPSLLSAPRERVLAALLAAEAVVPSVRGPFGVLCWPPESPPRRRRKSD